MEVDLPLERKWQADNSILPSARPGGTARLGAFIACPLRKVASNNVQNTDQSDSPTPEHLPSNTDQDNNPGLSAISATSEIALPLDYLDHVGTDIALRI